MTTGPATVMAMAVLAGAGLLPVVALVGLRWVTAPLAPLGGAVIAALGATGFLGFGGSFMGWFVGLAVLGAVVVAVIWRLRPERRPWRRADGEGAGVAGHRLAGIIGAMAILAACVWSLRGLSTPTVGFDARALWLMRAGWFLQSHHQLMVNMRLPGLVLIQTPYPPLVSASTAVAWSVTGDATVRLGVVVMAILNACVLATAAFGLVECGRRCAVRMVPSIGDGGRREVPRAHSHSSTSPSSTLIIPQVAGVVSAVLLVFIAFGVTEPFITNGYADPMWSLAAVGAMAYALQVPRGGGDQAVVMLLLLVAGLTKEEGTVTAAALIVLVAIRSLAALSGEERRRQWWRPVVLGLGELAVIGSWPLLMRIIHARGITSTFSSPGDLSSRAQATYHGLVPYLHVLALAAPVALVGGLFLGRVRRTVGAGNDWWGWAALASGLAAVSGALITGTGPIKPWILSTVHRITEFPVLAAWWIVAVWFVVATSGAVVARRSEETVPSSVAEMPAARPQPTAVTVSTSAS